MWACAGYWFASQSKADRPLPHTAFRGFAFGGDFRAGALTGKGTYFYTGGVTYEGDIVDGRPRAASRVAGRRRVPGR